MRGAPPYDHIVIETTGIAEPKAIRANFQAAEDYAMPLMDVVRLDTMVTVVRGHTHTKTGTYIHTTTTPYHRHRQS